MRKLVLTVWDDGLWFASDADTEQTVAKGEWTELTNGLIRATVDDTRDEERDSSLCKAACHAIIAMKRGARG
jgi:hypothetical protein